MLEFLKNLFKKLFGKKTKMLEEPKNEVVQDNSMEETKIDFEEDNSMFGYLSNIMKSCENYESFKNTKIELNKKKEEMNNLNEILKKEVSVKNGENT